ncbi:MULTISPECIES: manganese efflux pump MntP family protein [unclassified Luteimonas]|uniref:manganese efflux pump MntP n=1 Tax=unclassified Luteimonas TaxID=2629088 RepID=UPI0018F0E243|nr:MULTISPECIES: manganese efflux pump MntP family protein [unclassified Luteimonas]MBJ6979064.1 manganese efflux pump [Luteimonas sp. MC1895]MBJ6985080.1 manganese efflux pump [Luteimonas sp. MC1750]QQO05741.1 manganese efflux pump [Luteimonas sp. MC1750]
MHPLSILMLGIAMSTDAFAAAVGKGAAMRRPQLRDALRAGLIFGAIEAVTPVVGWALGTAASAYVTAWDHWIAFTLLTLLGLRMIRAGIRGMAGADDDAADAPVRHGFWALAATGFATSIDAMAVGVGLAFLDVNILAVAATIGLTTLVMVTAGILLGRVLGAMAGRRAEIGGGVLLIAIGAFILFEHLGGMA